MLRTLPPPSRLGRASPITPHIYTPLMDIENLRTLRTALHRVERDEGITHEIHSAPPTNRGHKLDAPTNSTQTIDVSFMADEIEYEEPLSPDDLKIDIAKVLQPISDPAEVSSHEVFRKIFTSPFMQTQSDELLDNLVDEKSLLAQIIKLMDAMLGDDDLAVMPLIMDKMSTIPDYPTPEPGKPLSPVEQNPDWFFNLPDVEIDRNQGLTEQEATDLRERLQVAQQRMIEYVRWMTEFREGLTRAQRLRRHVLNWCREMNNEDYVKEDLDLQNNQDNEGLGEQPSKDM